MATLEARQITKQYKTGRQVTVEALRGVDFRADRGEFLAIMGPSGSGKSTLLHLLGGMDRPTSGEIILDGQNLVALGERALTLVRRRRIGFIFQFFNLVPTLDVEENILLPLLIDGKSKKQLLPKLDEILRTVELEQRRHHRPDQLSGGEQQRVAVARTLMGEPSIILADEPTGNLDSVRGFEIVALLERMSSQFGHTVVVATHDARIADRVHRVVRLTDGRVCK